MGWLMIGGAAMLAAGGAWIIVKHDLNKIQGLHSAAKAEGGHRLAKLGLITCAAGAYGLFHFGTDMI